MTLEELTLKYEKKGLSYYDVMLQQEKGELYHPAFATTISPDGMPSIPINPKEFVTKVQLELNKKKVFFSQDTADVVEGLCKLLNYNIKGDDNEKLKSYFYAAETGIGKSVSLQVYVSMLKNESSLIIVSTVEEAIKYCEYINQLHGSVDYARCYYAKSDKNKDNLARVNKSDLKDYRCIIITHSMFKRVNLYENIDLYKLYQTKSRDLIVIDERISFYLQYQFSLTKVDSLIERIEYIKQTALNVTLSKEIDIGLNFLNALKDFLLIVNEATDVTFNATELVKIKELEEYMTRKDLTITKSLEVLKLLLETRIDELFNEIKQIGNLSNNSFKEQVLWRLSAQIDDMQMILSDDFLYYKSNYEKSFFIVKNIAYELGKSVVLDATANINEFYQVANRYEGLIAEIKVKRIRKYTNLTIYKAQGYNQSRNAIYKKDVNTTQLNADMYLSYVYNILKKSNDKLLIVCHKDFLPTIKLKCSDKRIVFTYWGNHIGKNNWSDCNKVMIIGWNFINPTGYISSFYNAINSITKGSYYINNDVIKSFEISQLADDLIQAVMRSKARIIDTKDSDCAETEIYLYYDGESYDNHDVLDLFESQFPEAKVIDWVPIGLKKVTKKTKPEEKADQIINLLKSKEKINQTYLLSDVKKETDIKGANMTRVLDSDYFKDQLQINKYLCSKKDGRSIYFILK